MSKFSKAFDQAEQDGALRAWARQHNAGTGRRPQTEPPNFLEVEPAAETPVPPESPVEEQVPRRETELPEISPDGVEEHLVSLLAPASFEAEQYRALRHLVEQMHRSAGHSIVGVTSPSVGDGKTITAINLAGALAQAPEARVLLVDADLRQSSVARRIGMSERGGRGLVDAILKPELRLEDVAQPRSPFNLSIVPAGRLPAVSYEVLKSPRVGDLLEEARRRFDYVILDTPPLVLVPDCRLIGKWVDAFLLVIAAHKTPRKLVEEALRVVDPDRILGLVFNGDDGPLAGYQAHYAYRRNGRKNSHGPE